MEQALSLPVGIIPKPSYENVEDVPLTDEESELALNRMRWEKLERLNKEEAERTRQRLKENLTRPWTWQEMLHFARYQSAERLKINLSVDRDNDKVIEALCKYFVSDPQFETMGEGWSLKKGIFLMGGVGTGKTTLMKLFSRNQKQCFQLASARYAADLYEQDGEKAIEHFSNPIRETGLDSRFFYQTELALCFDDLGTEKTPVVRYGNKTNVMADILLNRYDAKLTTHLTTNLMPEELEPMYGSRVKSRMREMFNLITVTGEDRR